MTFGRRPVYRAANFLSHGGIKTESMKAAVQFLFIVFYAVSGYATGQSRVSFIVNELQHFTARSAQTTVDNSYKTKLLYTPFREAKRSHNDTYGVPDDSEPVLVHVSGALSFRSVVSPVSSALLKLLPSRAPPSLL